MVTKRQQNLQLSHCNETLSRCFLYAGLRNVCEKYKDLDPLGTIDTTAEAQCPIMPTGSRHE